MSRPPRALVRRLGAPDWLPVQHALSGAAVWRVNGRAGAYVKVVPKHDEALARELIDEAQRSTWLLDQGIPAAQVLELDGDTEHTWLITAALPGVPASDPWPARVRADVVDALAELARGLHALPVRSCPFDRTLTETMSLARRAVDTDTVELGRLDAERAGWSAEQLWSELVATRPAGEDLVVCHGDLCLPNVLLDPADLRVTGVIDVGRLGIADRYLDLALATRSISAETLNPQFGARYAHRFLERYGVGEPDVARLAFYRLLDEFF